MPKSKPSLSLYLLSEHVSILGAFNQFSAYILIFEIGFLIFQNFFLDQNGDISKGYPLEILKIIISNLKNHSRYQNVHTNHE